MNIGIIGLGLIGGSKALAAKKAYNQCKIWGDDRNPNHLKEAKQLGLIDEVLDKESYKVLDLLILAIPVDKALDVI
ncbi:MAG: prephenate dehydrogenase/arogenate dehydrogenase family protein, partial [Flavobacteriaceae bacterium]|nr:prephenate dehydrogenase/arogenate dehydrogenase family protein [Flavobacteriaceae bacterium]